MQLAHFGAPSPNVFVTEARFGVMVLLASGAMGAITSSRSRDTKGEEEKEFTNDPRFGVTFSSGTIRLALRSRDTKGLELTTDPLLALTGLLLPAPGSAVMLLTSRWRELKGLLVPINDDDCAIGFTDTTVSGP